MNNNIDIRKLNFGRKAIYLILSVTLFLCFTQVQATPADRTVDDVIATITGALQEEGWIVDHDLPPGGVASWDKRTKSGQVDLRLSLMRLPNGYITEDLGEQVTKVLPDADFLGNDVFFQSSLVNEIGFFLRVSADEPIGYFHYRQVAFADKIGPLTLMGSLQMDAGDNLEAAKKTVRRKMQRLRTGFDTIFNLGLDSKLTEKDDQVIIEFLGYRYKFIAPSTWHRVDSQKYLAEWRTDDDKLAAFGAVPRSQSPSDWLNRFRQSFGETKVLEENAKDKVSILTFKTQDKESPMLYRNMLVDLGSIILFFHAAEPVPEDGEGILTEFGAEFAGLIKAWKPEKILK